MGMVGVIVGPTRLPNGLLTGALRGELDALGFFDWIKT